MVGPAQTYKEKPRQNGWIIVPPTVPLSACSSESDLLNLCYRGPDRNVVLWWINHPMTSRWSDAKPWRRTAGPVWSISKSLLHTHTHKKKALDGEIFIGRLKLMVFLGEKLQTHFHFTLEVDEHDDTQQLLTAGRCHLCRGSFRQCLQLSKHSVEVKSSLCGKWRVRMSHWLTWRLLTMWWLKCVHLILIVEINCTASVSRRHRAAAIMWWDVWMEMKGD